MNIKTEIEKAIVVVCKRIATETTTLQESLDVLKSLAPYYTALNKGKKASEDDSPDTANFGNFAHDIAGATGEEQPDGGAKIPGRRRHS